VISVMLLSLLSVLFLALFSMSRTEMRSATIYSDQLEARNLADIANNVVIGQIRDATGRVGEAWASQPGAIRRYGLNGQFKAGHKLYSDSDMVVNAQSALSADLPVSDWDQPSNAARYVDLNEPVVRGVDTYFPIVDPRAAYPPSGNPVEGFAYSAAVNGVKTGTADPRLPMPVEWLYTLLDGTVGYLDSSNKFKALETGGSPVIPTVNNPIVGRVAFWADDESSKVNVNTASEPTYWDLPRTVSADLQGGLDPKDGDLSYAKYQPYHGEFQRYPGHPAQTALSPILFPGSTLTAAQEIARKEIIYSLVPRIVPGGSKSGTAYVDIDVIKGKDSNDVQQTGILDDDNYALEPEDPPHHLYASVDEFLLGVDRQDQSPINRAQLERSRFFLTAHSSAPELNVFGLPRIAIWPIDSPHRANSGWSPYDNAMKFCSTVASRNYIFQRVNHRSTRDWYLREGNNRDLYKYADRLMSTDIPGQGGNFSNKYGLDQQQILTEVFDYIRCTNLHDQSHPNAGTTGGGEFTNEGKGYVAPLQYPPNNTMGFGRYPSVSEIGIIFICSADAGTVPRSGLASEAGPPVVEGNPAVDTYISYPGASFSPATDKLIQAYVYLESFTPGQGWTNMSSTIRADVEIDGFKLGTAPGQDFFAATTRNINNKGVNPGGGWHGRRWGGGQGMRGWSDARFTSKFMKISRGASTMSFSGGTVRVRLREGNTTIQSFAVEFPRTTLPVPKIQTTGSAWFLKSGRGNIGNSAPADVADFWWDMEQRRGQIDENPYYPWGSATDPPSSRGHIDADREREPGKGAMIRPGDVVRSVAVHHGDSRHVAGQSNPSSSLFRPNYYYDDVNRMADHTISQEAGMHYYHGFSNGVDEDGDENPAKYSQSLPTQLTDATYHFSKMPDYPKGSLGTANGNIRTGDFDNGIGVTADGAYINKPDEGNSQRADRSGNSEIDKDIPYFTVNWGSTDAGKTYQSPNRMVPSPVMFGSLPTGIRRDKPWETLLFRKQDGHPNDGTTHPQDHYLLDLFWMPVVEPYAISEPFATAGKLNLNTQIVPFAYIDRKTALHALIGDEHMLAVPDKEAEVYKIWDHAYADYQVPTPPEGLRLPVHKEKTLEQLDAKFATGEIFRSATELCDLYIIPDTTNSPVSYPQPDASSMESFWEDHSPTGDNSRERPYANLYPRVTTKSNVFRVHVRAQTVRKGRGTPVDEFDPDRDTVVSEYRGSTVLGRHLDPNTPGIPDYLNDISAIGGESLDRYYQFRVIHSKRFDP